MNTTHVGIGGLFALAGIAVAWALRAYAGIDVSNENGAAVGTGIGVGLGHILSGPGLVPAIKRALFGPAAKVAPPASSV